MVGECSTTLWIRKASRRPGCKLCIAFANEVKLRGLALEWTRWQFGDRGRSIPTFLPGKVGFRFQERVRRFTGRSSRCAGWQGFCWRSIYGKACVCRIPLEVNCCGYHVATGIMGNALALLVFACFGGCLLGLRLMYGAWGWSCLENNFFLMIDWCSDAPLQINQG